MINRSYAKTFYLEIPSIAIVRGVGAYGISYKLYPLEAAFDAVVMKMIRNKDAQITK